MCCLEQMFVYVLLLQYCFHITNFNSYYKLIFTLGLLPKHTLFYLPRCLDFHGNIKITIPLWNQNDLYKILIYCYYFLPPLSTYFRKLYITVWSSFLIQSFNLRAVLRCHCWSLVHSWNLGAQGAYPRPRFQGSNIPWPQETRTDFSTLYTRIENHFQNPFPLVLYGPST